MSKDGEVLTIREFARRVHYSERQIRQGCIDGKITASKNLGRKWLIPATEIERFTANPGTKAINELGAANVAQPQTRTMDIERTCTNCGFLGWTTSEGRTYIDNDALNEVRNEQRQQLLLGKSNRAHYLFCQRHVWNIPGPLDQERGQKVLLELKLCKRCPHFTSYVPGANPNKHLDWISQRFAPIPRLALIQRNRPIRWQ